MGCPRCEGTNIVSFNWSAIRSGQDAEKSKYLESILFLKKLKYGYLYQCKNCQAHWWLEEGFEDRVRWIFEPDRMYLIEDDKFHLFKKWAKKSYHLSAEHLKILEQIKQTPTDYYGNSKKYVIYPCAVLTKQNIWHEKALIGITQLPSLNSDPKFTLFIDDIVEIKPSPYALPYEVRAATAGAQERGMGFAPTIVATPTNQLIILNGPTHFFDYHGFKGEDIKLANKEYNRFLSHDFYPPEKNVYWVIVDS